MTDNPTQLDEGATVLVTGAAGALGRHVVRAALDAGLEVRAASRTPAGQVELYGLFDPLEDVDWWCADLTSADLDALVDGCDAVVHAAARVELSPSYDALAPANVELVGRLYQACVGRGVAHFVHVSCGAIYRPDDGVRSEADPLEARNDYEQTKIDSEAVLPEAAETTRWTVVRPALIYGPHCSKMGSAIATLPPILRGFTPYLPGMTGGPRTNWCHVEDAASAVLFVLGRADAYERTFNVADDTPLGFGEVITSITEAYELEVGPLVPFPNAALWKALSPLTDRESIFELARRLLRDLWRRLQKRHDLQSPLRPRVDKNALFYVESDNIIGADALEELGWSPRYRDFRQGIVETIRWYQRHGWAPRFDTETKVRLRDRKQTLGFGFSETLEGRWIASDSGREGEAKLALDAEFPDAARLALDLEGNVDGRLTLVGLADEADVRGTVRLRLLSDDGLLYEMGFDDDEGRPHRLKLVRRADPVHPIEALTRLDGEVYGSDGRAVGRVELTFDVASEFARTMKSVRILV